MGAFHVDEIDNKKGFNLGDLRGVGRSKGKKQKCQLVFAVKYIGCILNGLIKLILLSII